MDGDKSVTAELTALPVYTLSTNVTPTGSGSVTRDPDFPLYLEGTIVELAAVPGASYLFQGWSGDLTGAANPTSTTMDSTKAISATFAVGCSVGSYEPNNTAGTYWYLGTVSEFDTEQSWVSRIVGQGDLDFYRVYAEEGNEQSSSISAASAIVGLFIQASDETHARPRSSHSALSGPVRLRRIWLTGAFHDRFRVSEQDLRTSCTGVC